MATTGLTPQEAQGHKDGLRLRSRFGRVRLHCLSWRLASGNSPDLTNGLFFGRSPRYLILQGSWHVCYSILRKLPCGAFAASLDAVLTTRDLCAIAHVCVAYAVHTSTVAALQTIHAGAYQTNP